MDIGLTLVATWTRCLLFFCHTVFPFQGVFQAKAFFQGSLGWFYFRGILGSRMASFPTFPFLRPTLCCGSFRALGLVVFFVRPFFPWLWRPPYSKKAIEVRVSARPSSRLLSLVLLVGREWTSLQLAFLTVTISLACLIPPKVLQMLENNFWITFSEMPMPELPRNSSPFSTVVLLRNQRTCSQSPSLPPSLSPHALLVPKTSIS